MAQTIGTSTALPSGLAECTGLKVYHQISDTSFLSSASLCVGFILREAPFVCMKDDQRVPGQCHPQSWQSSREKERFFPNSSRNKVRRKTLGFLAWPIAPYLNQSPEHSALARTVPTPASMVRERGQTQQIT